MNPSASSAPATSASSPRPASPSSAATSTASTSTRTRSSASKRGEIPIYEPGLAELVAKHRERLHFSTDIADALEHARLLFVAVGTPPTYSGDADLSAVHAVVDAMPPSDRHALVMKSTVPVGTGALDQAHLRRAGQGGLPLRLVPGVPQGGLGGRRLPAARPRRRRRRRRLGRRRRRRALRAARRAARAHRHRQRPRWSSSPSNAFLATKISFINEIANVCEETGADVDRGRAGMGLDDRIGPKFLQAGHRLRRLVLPEGRHRAQAARRQLRLPLPAAQRGDRGQRAAEAPRDRQAREAPRLARRQARSRCSAWRSSRTPTTCARRPRSCSARACRPPARRSAPTTRSPRTRRAS